jgi:hypothetical protein
MEDGTKRMLLGIEVTLIGVIVAVTSSGSAGALALVVGLVGLAICGSGMVAQSRS